MPDSLFLIGVICLVGGVLYIALAPSASHPLELDPTPPADEPDIAGERLRVLTASELIERLDLAPTIANLRANLGLADETWQKDALPLIHAFLTLVQRLPASESHHHAGDGGLARHTLDVAILALNLSTAKSWPPGASTEEIARLTAVWRYGILIGALLHDIGKTLTGFEVTLYSSTKEKTGSLWFADAGTMKDAGTRWYRLAFPEEKVDYRLHTQLGWLFFKALVPSHVSAWLAASDPSLMKTLRDYLTGGKEAPFAQLIAQADQASVKRDLKQGSRQRFIAAKRRPLIEVIMDTLQEMLAEPGAHFSIGKTSGGDLFRRGDFVYIVCAKVPNHLRDYLKAHSPASLAGFPTDNERVFDTLLEYGAVEPCPFDENRAVTPATVTFQKMDGSVSTVTFTMLCFRLTTLYRDPARYPPEYQGQMQVHQRFEEVPKQAAKQLETESATASMSFESTSITETNTESDLRETAVAATEDHQPIPGAASSGNSAESKAPHRQTTESSVNTAPIPAPQRKRVGNIRQGGIDALLAGMLDETDLAAVSDTGEDHQTATTDTANRSVTNETLLRQTEPVPEPMMASVPAPSTSQKRTPPAKAVKQLLESMVNAPTTSKPTKQAARNRDVPVTEAPAASSLPSVTETAMADASEIPAVAPRPVHVHQPDPGIIHLQDPRPEGASTAQEAVIKMLHGWGNRFLTYLAEGLATGSIAYNNAAAPVHFVPEGMLLVTPRIFKDFAGGQFDKNDKNSPGVLAQRGFESLKLHQVRKHRRGSTAHWMVVSANEEKKQLFSAYLIPEAKLHLIIQPASRPANNLQLSLDELRLCAS